MEPFDERHVVSVTVGGRIQGIIFDMDNTLLRSRIDFAAMKQALLRFLVRQEVLAADLEAGDLTVAQVVEQARRSPRLSPAVEEAMWAIVVQHETEGMRGAGLEPGVHEVLSHCRGRYHLVVLTNNAQQAAELALRETGIVRYFDHVVGREQVRALKPSPAGVLHILGLYPDVEASGWLAVGDAWIDGKAAQDAGVPFVAYQANAAEMERRGVKPVGYIRHLSELFAFLPRGDGELKV